MSRDRLLPNLIALSHSGSNLALFEPPPQPIPPVQDQRVQKMDLPRLKGQNLRVLERLRQGPATNVQLAELLGAASGWRTRVSNVRVWLERHEGLTIKSERVREGIWSYEIRPLFAVDSAEADA